MQSENLPYVCAFQDNAFVSFIEHTLVDMVCVFQRHAKDLYGPTTDSVMTCFRVRVKVGHCALELNSSISPKRN